MAGKYCTKDAGKISDKFRWHKTTLPPKDVTAGINYVITAFAPSTTFNWGSSYTPFMPLDDIRKLFDEGTKVCMAIGGWGDTSGFSTGAVSDESRKRYAKNVADALTALGYDCVGTLTIFHPPGIQSTTDTAQTSTGSIPAATARTTSRTLTRARSPRLRRTRCCSRRSRLPSATRSSPLPCPARRAT